MLRNSTGVVRLHIDPVKARFQPRRAARYQKAMHLN